MFRQIMNIVITPLGHAQIYNHGVRSVFIMTGINTLYNNISLSKNNKSYNTHESDTFLKAPGHHKGMWLIGGLAPFSPNLCVRL
jgi:hypothetical protein